VVVHHLGAPAGVDDGAAAAPALVGLVVSRAVGGSVVRHRVARRLRGVLSGHLDELPPGSATVVRALPDAADALSARLDADVRAALGRVISTPASVAAAQVSPR
jgi:ribonuclease P protein component